ncbi:MAG: ABC transporter permease [Actinomycetota bacterium]
MTTVQAASGAVPGRPAGFAAATGLFAVRTIRRFLGSRQQVIATLAFPMLLMFLMLAAFGELVGDTIEGDYIDRLAPLMVAYTAAFGAASTGQGLFADANSGFLGRVRSMPVSPWSLLTGRLVGDAVRSLGVTVIIVAVAHLAGFRFEQGPAAAVGFLVLAAAFGTLFAWPAMLVGLTAASEEAASTFLNAPLTLLLFLSSGFVPLDAFPGALQPVVAANPLSVAVNAFVGLSRGGPIAVPVAQTLAWVAAVTVLTAPLAVRRYRAGLE